MENVDTEMSHNREPQQRATRTSHNNMCSNNSTLQKKNIHVQKKLYTILYW